MIATIYDFKWLISNYGMLSHNKITCMSQIDYKEGIIFALVLYVLSIIIGMIYFMRCNILLKEKEEI